MKRMRRLWSAMLLPLLLLLANSAAYGQELPPGPKTVYRSTLPGITMQGEFELINLILDFAPGAATPLHTHGGPGIVTVLDGEMTFNVEGKPDQVLKAGETYLDMPGTHHTAANKTSNPARVSYFALLPKGATLTTVSQGGQAGELPPGPKTVYRSTIPGLTVQGELEMINLILDFAPGAATPAHTHGGPGIVTVLDGELTFAVQGQPDQVAKAGGVYADLPGTVHTAANKTSSLARVSYAAVLPKGAALTTVAGASQPPAQQPAATATATAPAQPAPVQQPATAQGEQIGMPRTGSPLGSPLMSHPLLRLVALAAMVLVVLGLGLIGLARRSLGKRSA